MFIFPSVFWLKAEENGFKWKKKKQKQKQKPTSFVSNHSKTKKTWLIKMFFEKNAIKKYVVSFMKVTFKHYLAE